VNGSEVATALDAKLSEQVLVVGSPPPGGRDLDLLARSDAHADIAEWLSDAGFLRARKTWAKFDGDSTYAVDLSPAEAWRSPTYDPTRLFRDAEPLPGYRHLMRPGPATMLLLAARGLVGRRGRLTDKSRARVTAALQRDPSAWVAAEQEALALGLVGAVRLLRTAFEAPQPLSSAARAAGIIGILRYDGPVRAKARLVVSTRPRRYRPVIVSFSGLDGAGKSTQVSRLSDTLHHLGFPAAVQWVGFANGQRLHAVISHLDRGREDTARRWSFPEETPGRERFMPPGFDTNPVGRHAWVFTITALNLVRLWRPVLLPRPDTKVLIFDRFSPDSAVKLDYHYRHLRHLEIRWQRAVFRLASPKPDVGFLLAVPSDTSYARREDWTPEKLAAMEEGYDEQAQSFGLIRLDGTDPVESLCRQVAIAAWRGI
jgi:thymidylate kinase